VDQSRVLDAGLLLLNAGSLLVLAYLANGMLWVRRRLPRLIEVEPSPRSDWPRVSVVVPARNEAPHVETAARSLLAQDYPNLEVVAIDDRSEDATGLLLDGLAAQDPRLRVVHIEHLPDGWLGKNHACARGAEVASGDWLLFTDGDVLFRADALRRSVALAEAYSLDHLVVFPSFVTHGFLERAFVVAFGVLFSLKTRVWALGRTRSRAYVGVGAFNLVRRDVYARVGGHRAVAFEVVDDLKLGLVLRRSGARQGAVVSGGLLAVRWQSGLRASLGGLMKNAFAGAEWRWSRAAVFCAGFAVVGVVPAATLAAPVSLYVKAVAAAAWLGWAILVGAAAYEVSDGLGVEGVAFPLASAALIGVVLASAARATLSGGITWRGTRYPLAHLRRGCVRERDWPVSRAVGWTP
jgi:glycosyltransferase involved in cell wall biosynthesis